MGCHSVLFHITEDRRPPRQSCSVSPPPTARYPSHRCPLHPPPHTPRPIPPLAPSPSPLLLAKDGIDCQDMGEMQDDSGTYMTNEYDMKW